MSNPFNWRDSPSQIGKSLARPVTVPSLAPKKFHIYARAAVRSAS